MNSSYKKSFKISDQIFFSQRLSLLLGSGISMVEALGMMRNIETHVYRKKVYEEISNGVEKGLTLSRSIQVLDLKFNHLLIALIRNGEQGGHLFEALSQAHIYLDKKNELTKRIVSSLVYPGFIVIATLFMALFLILYIFPKIIPLLTSLDIQLPLMTRIVQGVYYFIISYGLYSLVSILLTAITLKLLINKNQNVKYKFHLMILRLHVVSRYIKLSLMASLCNMGEMLLSSGKGIQELLIFSKESSRNIVYRDIFEKIYLDSVSGVSLSISLSKHKVYFPVTMIDMVSLGERTGNLGIMLGHCSKIFEQDIDNALKKFTSLVEPVLMVLMGLVVGSIALSIILPVYEITNHISK